MITGLILILVCVLPFIIVNQINQGRNRKYLKQLQVLAAEMNARITQYETWSGAAIGVDEHDKHLFFIKKVKDEFRNTHINLNNVKNCRVIHAEKSATQNSKPGASHGRIDLVFTSREKNEPDSSLEFYNADYDSISLSHELQLTDKWSGIMNKLINH